MSPPVAPPQGEPLHQQRQRRRSAPNSPLLSGHRWPEHPPERYPRSSRRRTSSYPSSARQATRRVWGRMRRCRRQRRVWQGPASTGRALHRGCPSRGEHGLSATSKLARVRALDCAVRASRKTDNGKRHRASGPGRANAKLSKGVVAPARGDSTRRYRACGIRSNRHCADTRQSVHLYSSRRTR
jgi:hypothetical protein